MLTCQQVDGDFLSSIYWVSGEGSSSYLSNGKFSTSWGSESTQEKKTVGCASLGVCKNIGKEIVEVMH